MDRHSDLDALGGFVPEDDNTTNPGDPAKFGEFLRQARERRQLTLQQVASDTNISSRHLSALEEGNVGALPPGMYRRAMLRAYADSVGINRETALEQFERTFEPETAAPARVPPASPAPPAAAVRAPQRGLKLLGLVVVATVAVALIGDDSEERAAAVATQDGSRAVAGAAAAPPAPATEQTPSAPQTPQTVAETPTAASPQEQPGVATPQAVGPAPTADRVAAPAAADRQAPSSPAASAAPTRPAPEPPAPVRAQAPAPAVPPTAATRREAPVAAPAAAAPSTAAAAAATRRASSGELVITSEPAGARVTVNGTGWGVTPVTVRHLTFGAKTVRVTKDGYVTQQRAVVLEPSRASARVGVTLSSSGQ